jgi:hypothetical protein
MNETLQEGETVATETPSETHSLHLPAHTKWPLVLALGITLILTAMVTSIYFALLGLALVLAGAVGWFRQVLPLQAVEYVPIRTEVVAVMSKRTTRARAPAGESHRKMLPVRTYSLVSGIRGGIAGGAAMTIPAALFGLVKFHSIWYAMNLLAAGGFVSWAGASDAFLSEFHWSGLFAALIIHSMVSLLVGLLYGAILPMFPRFPILTAGIVVPLFFTAIVYSALGIVSPILNNRIDWLWFVLSQVAFGLVCGFVVNLHEKVRTPQFRDLSFGERAGIHGDNLEDRSEDEGQRDSE